jgi:PPOX class probable F420-dependent enzyme
MGAIPEKFPDLFQKKAFAQLATLMPDGSPHVSPVWFDYDGRNILINTAKGRVKDRNMRRDPRVGLDIVDPDNPYRHVSIRGRVVNVTEEGADEHIDKLAKKYLGVDRYPNRTAGEVRVLYKIEPEHTFSMKAANCTMPCGRPAGFAMRAPAGRLRIPARSLSRSRTFVAIGAGTARLRAGPATGWRTR